MFRVKNISNNPNAILQIDVDPNETVDLLEHITEEEVVNSLLFGELYKKLWGRMFGMLTPSDIFNLPLTEEQYANLIMSGVLQGYLGLEDFKHPLNFTPTGELITNTKVEIPEIKISKIEIETKHDGYNLIEVGSFTNTNQLITNYYIDMLGWKFIGLWIELKNNTTCKIYCSGEFNKPSNTASYVDLTECLCSVLFLEENDTHLINIDTPFLFRWIKLELTVSDINDNYCNILANQMKSI